MLIFTCSICKQIAEKINGGDEMVERTRAPVIRPPATPFSKAEFGESLTGNEQNGKKIHGVLVKDEGDVDLIPHTKSFVSLSSHKEHLGVLYSDYSRPRTRPPSHN